MAQMPWVMQEYGHASSVAAVMPPQAGRPVQPQPQPQPQHHELDMGDQPAAKRARHYGGPIATMLDGHRFRSRNEARLAVFLGKLGVPYDFEGCAFSMRDGTRYTPDFYLIEQRTWIEFKPRYPHQSEIEKVAELCKRGYRTVLLYGDKYVAPFGVDAADARGGPYGRVYTHADGLRGMAFDGSGRRLAGDAAFTMDGLGNVELAVCATPYEMAAAARPARLLAAYTAARDAHFD
jgi:hypothetical protein